MKLIYLVVALFVTILSPVQAYAFDESVNFQPGLSLWNDAAQLTDLIGAHGSQLCAPIAMTHGMHYLRDVVGFRSLATVKDLDNDGVQDTYKDRIRYFFAACGTDVNTGTHYHEAQACMSQYVQASGYKPWAYIIGPHAINAPLGTPLQTMQHTLTINDVRSYLKQKLMVIMAVGWYDYNPATRAYTRIGGHFFNLYGYDYNAVWGESQISLQAVNSLQNYSARAPAAMSDTLQMTAVPADGTTYPSDARFVITGPGFNFVQKTLVEDIFVVWPLAP
jgi:hypothetical protein